MLLNWPAYWALLVIFLATNLVTSVMSNAASVALLVPVATSSLPLNLPPRLSAHGSVRRQPILSDSDGLPNQPDGVWSRQISFFDVARYGAGSPC